LTQHRQSLQDDRDQQAQLRSQELASRAALQSDLNNLRQMQAKERALQNQLSLLIQKVRSELVSVGHQDPLLAQQIVAQLDVDYATLLSSLNLLLWDQVQSAVLTRTVLSLPRGPAARISWPTQERDLSQGFGPSLYYFEPAYGGYTHFHTGIDIPGPNDEPILAAAAGVVVVAEQSLLGGVLVGYGNYVVIAHDGGLLTLYAHLNAVAVNVGDTVIQGEPIGLEGSTGNSTGTHLHFEVRVGNEPVDPIGYLISSGAAPPIVASHTPLVGGGSGESAYPRGLVEASSG
jgi:murein DD-endopeptidase MepM/ murein hydrolase activator NlpD